MTEKKIIEQILSRHPEISKKEVLERLDKDKRRTGGFISDDVLLRMILAEFGVEIRRETPKLTLSIQDLVPGLNDVTVVGRVVAVFPSRTFKGRRSGKVASLLVADKSTILRVVLWNDKTELIESGKVKVGDIIIFSHGYTKEDYSGKVELHVGDRSEIEIKSKDAKVKDYPTITKFLTRIGDITRTHKNKNVNIMGTVKKLFPVSTFEKHGSNRGKVMRFILVDETGEMQVVVWNEKVEELEEKLKIGLNLQLVNAKVKKGISEGLEIHINSGTYVEVSEPAEEYLQITELREGLKHVNVKGVVVTKPVLRNVKTSKGEHVKLVVFELEDETGKIWVSAWRNHADIAGDLKTGDEAIIRNAYVKKGFGDQLELSTRNATSIAFLSKQLEQEQ